MDHSAAALIFLGIWQAFCVLAGSTKLMTFFPAPISAFDQVSVYFYSIPIPVSLLISRCILVPRRRPRNQPNRRLSSTLGFNLLK